MNFLGRILVVLIFVLSILFMYVGIQVYATHRDWEALATSRQADLTKAQADLQAKVNELNRLDEESKATLDAQVQQIRKLESERERLAQDNARNQQELDQFRQQNREAVAAVESTQRNNETLVTEITGLRSEIRETQTDRDQLFVETLEATEQTHAIRNDLEIITERNRDLVTDTARMTTVMRENGIDPTTPVDAVTPRVDGYVSAVARRAGAQYVEMTIGADDGLKQGHTVEVFRDGTYLGRVVVEKTAPDRSIGRVDTRFQKGFIQENDRVATRLSLN